MEILKDNSGIVFICPKNEWTLCFFNLFDTTQGLVFNQSSLSYGGDFNYPVQAVSLRVQFNSVSEKLYIYMEMQEDMFVMALFTFDNWILHLDYSFYQTEVVESLASFTFLGSIVLYAGLNYEDNS